MQQHPSLTPYIRPLLCPPGEERIGIEPSDPATRENALPQLLDKLNRRHGEFADWLIRTRWSTDTRGGGVEDVIEYRLAQAWRLFPASKPDWLWEELRAMYKHHGEGSNAESLTECFLRLYRRWLWERQKDQHRARVRYQGHVRGESSTFADTAAVESPHSSQGLQAVPCRYESPSLELAEVLEKLDEFDSNVARLVGDGHSIAEVAERLGRAGATVHAALVRVRSTLRRHGFEPTVRLSSMTRGTAHTGVRQQTLPSTPKHTPD